MEVAEHNAEIAGLPVRWLRAGDAPVLYLHGVPNSGEIWRPFLERSGGIAPDLPGFGRSGKGGDFDYSIEGYDRFLEAFAEYIGLDRLGLVMHDWGAVGLAPAQRFPERIERLALIAAVPFLPGYRWHRIARIWRTRVLGELFMGSSSRWAFKQLSRESNVEPGPLPDDFVREIWRYFDHGTQRAILRLYRSAPEEVLARAGEDLGKITCPALVAWGTRDPYLPDEFAQRYAEALGGEAEVELTEGGHWLWLDRPELVERVVEFVGGGVG
jgi:pimeloyl-ACP methyl ester carboxylesterase